MSILKCPQCGSNKLREAGFHAFLDGNHVRRYKCEQCYKSFPAEYRHPPAQDAGIDCPRCGSSKTVKRGSPKKLNHGTVQPSFCKNCGKYFRIGGRQRIQIFLDGKVIYQCWNPPGIRHMPNIACPNCNQKKAALKTEYWSSRFQRKACVLICLACGRTFRGEGRAWSPGTRRMLGKKIPCHHWQFDDDKWDLRELYPHIEEYKFSPLFLNFSNCGSHWFNKLVKNYILWRIQVGSKFSTLYGLISTLGFYGRFLEQQEVMSMEQIDRHLLATYWTQERGHLSREKLFHEIGNIKSFFIWGNAEQHFTTSATLITSFDRPKLFQKEPDPLEDSVIEKIRNNLHVLPEPLQLMFMLGFWLGTRPSELCQMPKNCLSLDLDGSTWWVEFKREKPLDEHRLPVTTDLVRLIQQQQTYINELHGEDYPYLFCHYQGISKRGYPNYPTLKDVQRPPMAEAGNNPMVKVIRLLIEQCEIKDSNGELAKFTGAILRPSRATYFIRNGFSLEFVRIWLKHRSAMTTKRHYTRYRPGELLDVACVMANMDGKFIPYDSNPESLLQNPELHELDGLKMPFGEPLYGYCIFREFCPRFGHCYTCGFHVASADKLAH